MQQHPHLLLQFQPFIACTARIDGVQRRLQDHFVLRSPRAPKKDALLLKRKYCPILKKDLKKKSI